MQEIDVDKLFIKPEDIIASLTIEDVKFFLESLGVSQIEYNPEKGYIICPTICHNPINEEASMKLYWYQNHKIFRCYTECNSAMSIFKLYQKFMELNYDAVSNEEAFVYIKNCIKHEIITNPKVPKTLWTIDKDKYKFSARIPYIPSISENVLTCFVKYYHPSWIQDGITIDAMDKFNILFSLSENKIIIPHYDINGNLIGIRGRALDEETVLNGQKYMPISIGNTMYNHQLGFNLYGCYENKHGLKKTRTAILVEGEKSVLLDYGFYGDNANAVACCGSNFNKYQLGILTHQLGVNEVIIAFDKEYDTWNDDSAKKWREKIVNNCLPFKTQVNFSYIWDFNNLLKRKDSPFDRGKEIFEKLYKDKVTIK